MEDATASRSPLNKREQNAGAVVTMLALALLLLYLSMSLVRVYTEETILAAIGGSVLVSVGLCLYVLRKYRKGREPLVIDYLNVSTQRYILALLMLMYGIDKLLGNFFDYQLFALDSKLSEVSEFQLAWYFYGKNRWQELFTGLAEFVPALLLLRRRTYYVGALLLLPVTAQVFLLNFFFRIGGITLPAATILLACDVYILYSEREKIARFFRSLDFRPPGITGGARTGVRILRAVGLFLAAAVVFMKVRPVLFPSAVQRKYHKLEGVYTLVRMTRNSASYRPVASDSAYYQDLYIEKQARWNILRRFNGETSAFILDLDARNDSLGLYLNRGGTGDDPDIIDSATALRGVYQLREGQLRIRTVQQADTLELLYQRQDRLRPKAWLW